MLEQNDYGIRRLGDNVRKQRNLIHDLRMSSSKKQIERPMRCKVQNELGHPKGTTALYMLMNLVGSTQSPETNNENMNIIMISQTVGMICVLSRWLNSTWKSIECLNH